MREILFRGRRIDNGEWVEGNLLQVELDSGTDYYIIPLVTNGSLVKTTLLLKFISPCFEVEENTIGQFTGIYDKNGKRIFEGGILKVYDYKCVAKFGFHEAGNGWYAETDDGVICELNDSFKIAEIISTIHDKEVSA